MRDCRYDLRNDIGLFEPILLLCVLWPGKVLTEEGNIIVNMYMKNHPNHGLAQLMPVIPELWKAKVGRSLEVRSSRPAWPTQEDLISKK